jgi:hypothetical protein
MPQDRPFVMTIPVPKDVTSIPALLPCQHLNTETVNEFEDFYPSGQYGPVSRWPIATDIVNSTTTCLRLRGDRL